MDPMQPQQPQQPQRNPWDRDDLVLVHRPLFDAFVAAAMDKMWNGRELNDYLGRFRQGGVVEAKHVFDQHAAFVKTAAAGSTDNAPTGEN